MAGIIKPLIFAQINKMTVNEFIKHLERLKPSLREGEIFIGTPNGMAVSPNTKILLNDGYCPWDDVDEKVKGTIITYE